MELVRTHQFATFVLRIARYAKDVRNDPRGETGTVTQVHRFIDKNDGHELGATPFPVETHVLEYAGARAVGRSFLGPRDGDDAIRIDVPDALTLCDAGLLVFA